MLVAKPVLHLSRTDTCLDLLRYIWTQSEQRVALSAATATTTTRSSLRRVEGLLRRVHHRGESDPDISTARAPFSAACAGVKRAMFLCPDRWVWNDRPLIAFAPLLPTFFVTLSYPFAIGKIDLDRVHEAARTIPSKPLLSHLLLQLHMPRPKIALDYIPHGSLTVLRPSFVGRLLDKTTVACDRRADDITPHPLPFTFPSPASTCSYLRFRYLHLVQL